MFCYKSRLMLLVFSFFLVSCVSFAAEDLFPLNEWVEVKTSSEVNEQLKLSSGKKYNWTQKVRLIRGKRYSLQIKWQGSSGRKVGILAYDPETYDGREIISGAKTRKWLIEIVSGQNAEYHKTLDFIVSEHSLTDIAYLMFCHKFPGKSVKIMLSDNIAEGKKVKGPPLLLKDLSGKNTKDGPESSVQHKSRTAIEILKWDSGGGNLMSPRITVSLNIHSNNARLVRLTALDGKGKTTELDSQKVVAGSPVKFSSKYSLMNTRFLEISVLDEKGSVIERLRRQAK